ncbi:hypothetical protein TcBrA4_0055990 [Trypanosoma cruzi]|nr:hypothetical protein TcBrA4_0055990 [Trypanosoma cruzi]
MVSIKEYIHLIGDSVNDADTARLAEEAVNAPTLFFYGSLFELNSVQKLRNNPSFAWIPQLMEILCYGMVDELHLLPGSAKKHLTPCIYQKMNKLSVLSLCIRDDTGGMLFIRDVQGAIGASTPLEAEELLIEMMSDGLLHGRIDQRGGVMILQDFAAREVRIEEVGRLREKLETWCRNCDAQIEMLEEMMKE